MANVILAHGILGYGQSPWGGDSNYFNGLAEHLRDQGDEVLTPTVDLLGHLDDRYLQLAQAIRDWKGRERIVVIAHSMGGLDIRRVVNRDPEIAKRIKTIVCIATPLFGSPVANAVLGATNSLTRLIPKGVRGLLDAKAGAIMDLQVREPVSVNRLQDRDVPGIRYIEVGCEIGSGLEKSAFADLSREIGKLDPSGNDGVVTLRSAQHPDRPLAEVWPVDHLGAIGWSSAAPWWAAVKSWFVRPTAHLQRYSDLLQRASG